jgi:hypothetical protein
MGKTVQRKRKPGRPKSPLGESFVCGIRLHKSELALAKSAADVAGVSLSELLRMGLGMIVKKVLGK